MSYFLYIFMSDKNRLKIIKIIKFVLVSRTLEKLETHRNKLKQTLSGLEFKKIEQKKLLSKRKQAFTVTVTSCFFLEI